MFRYLFLLAGAILTLTSSTKAQNLIIEGVADRTSYTDRATFRVQTNAGFSYVVTLNGVEVPAGISNTVSRMDYYDLLVQRTDTSTLAVSNALVRFIVLSSQRGSPERGLIQWVPLPPIPSTAAEVSGAGLELMAPEKYPAGLEIPLIARVKNEDGRERRVNGWISAPGHEASAFRLLRGVGFGLLPGAAAGTNLTYAARLQTLFTNHEIEIEAATSWTPVSGVLGTTSWPTNARIHVTGNLTIPAGATLTIGAGTVVRLNPGVNITNSGRTVIGATLRQPVVFTPTNRVAPEQRTGAWGGWFLRGASAELIANGAIMTGSGAAGSISYTPASSHRSEQPLLLVHSNATVRMTNCALINLAGQVGNGYYSSIIWDHCLIQRAITCGEYEGCTNVINRSALIEFPSVDGVYNATIADADYDGYYTIRGTNYFAESLFGFAKDDAIDSGSGGAGSVVVSNCWVESALHEALAWSGEGRRTWTYNSVLLNCGQGIECGWSTGNNSPLCYASNLLSTANSVGARYGDNYEGTTGLGLKTGFLTVTNSYILHNYRDIWGQVWDNTWNYRVAFMDLQSNYVTTLNTNHPANFIWNPAVDGARLAGFMTTPPEAAVGIGLGTWGGEVTAADLTNGIPVRLSSFTPHEVSVDYTIESPTAALAGGRLTFPPGRTVERIFSLPATVAGAGTWRVVLSNPAGGELTGATAAYALPALPGSSNSAPAFIGTNGIWKYLDDGSDQGTAWRAPSFNDTTWSNGVAQLGFGDGDETTRIRRTNTTTAGASLLTYYFRQAFTVADPGALSGLSLWMLRDDGGVVYLNGTEVLRSPSLPAAPAVITAATRADAQGSSPADNTIDTAILSASLLVPGTNVVAVEVHQFDPPSSDLSFSLTLTGLAVPAPARLETVRFGRDLAAAWAGAGYVLEEAPTVLGPWTYVTENTPATVTVGSGQRFYRLRKP